LRGDRGLDEARHSIMSRSSETTVDLDERAARQGERRSPFLTWVFPERVAGQAVALEHGTTLGRGEHCSVQVACDGVSRQHVEITREGPALIARDCDSTNGTFVDGRRCQHARLREGSVLRLGNTLGIVSWNAPGERAEGFGCLASGLWGGKELCAQALHDWSGRTGRFLAINCTALPKELAEAELFGYRRGAFTGAAHENPGYFRSAQRGTLLLDEVNELPLPIQAKLLRVIQEQAVTPLGQAEPLSVDVRVVCASQVPLARAVSAGTFRSDLFMRLNGLQIELPPLRTRRADVPRLLQTFLSKGASLTGRANVSMPEVQARVVEALCLYPWPGNVRELELLTQRLLSLHADAPCLELEHLPPELRRLVSDEADGGGASPDSARSASLNEPSHAGSLQAGSISAEPALDADRAQEDLSRLAALLRQNGANLSRACAALGISRQRAYRLLAGRSVPELLAEQKH
jgi:transcriptional regulator with AAA-type ATPase domain